MTQIDADFLQDNLRESAKSADFLMGLEETAVCLYLFLWMRNGEKLPFVSTCFCG